MATNIQRTSIPNHRAGTYQNKDFTGIVVDNNDPEKNERVKMRIKGVHDDISDDDLPWVSVSRNGGQANGGTMGSIGPIPPIGTAIRGQSPDGTLYNMQYSSSATGDKQQASELYQGKDTTGNDYPHATSSIDSAGNRTTVNTKRNTMDYEHASGTRVSVDGSGRMVVTVGDKKVGGDAQEKHAKGFTLHIQGDANVRATGNVNLGADKDIIGVANGNISLGAKNDVTIFAGRNMKLQAAMLDMNDGSATMPKMKSLAEPPTRNVPKPNMTV